MLFIEDGIAASIMYYTEHKPAVPLAPYIGAYYMIATRPEGAAFSLRFFPDGAPEICIVLNGVRIKRLAAQEGVLLPEAFVIGPMSQSIVFGVPLNADLLGVKLHVGAARALFHVPQHELADHIIDLRSVMPPTVLDALFALGDLPAQLRPAYLDRIFYNLVRPKLAFTPEVRHAVHLIQQCHGQLAANLLQNHVSLGRRQLERQFLATVGLSPTRLARIARFAHVIRLMRRTDSVDWGAIAADAGYYDQSHLINDIRTFTDNTPGALMREDTNVDYFQDSTFLLQ